MILIDTNVWSELTKNPADPTVVAWLLEHEAELLLSSIVLAEIRAGIEAVPAGRKRQGLTEWCAQLQADYGERSLDFESQAAQAFGRLVVQGRLQQQQTKMFDLLIAAQALAFAVPIATRNVRDFDWTGADVINPWIP